jgi:hypothetical protein
MLRPETLDPAGFEVTNPASGALVASIRLYDIAALTFTTTQQTLNISLKSTSSVNTSISTSHGNMMVRQGAVTPYPTNEAIPYTMTFNSISMPAAGLSNQNYARAGVGGESWPLILNLPSLPTGKLAGLYQDVITLTLSAGN